MGLHPSDYPSSPWPLPPAGWARPGQPATGQRGDRAARLPPGGGRAGLVSTWRSPRTLQRRLRERLRASPLTLAWPAAEAGGAVAAESWGNRGCGPCELKDFSLPCSFSLPSRSPRKYPAAFRCLRCDSGLLISVNQPEISDAGQRQPICLSRSQRSLFPLLGILPGQAPRCRIQSPSLNTPAIAAAQLSRRPLGGTPPPAAGLAGSEGGPLRVPWTATPRLFCCLRSPPGNSLFRIMCLEKHPSVLFSFFLSCTLFSLFSSRQ